MKKVLLLIFAMALGVLSGCASTTVHLHAESLSSNERDNLRAGLEAQGFQVKMRDNESPSSENIILYYPHKGIEEDLRAIDKVLGAGGLTAEHRYSIHTDKLGAHEYTAGNIGVYIVPEGSAVSAGSSLVRPVFPITITEGEFVSIDCESEYLYEFSESGTVKVADLSLPLSEMDVVKLEWKSLSEEKVIIMGDAEVFEYQKSKSHRKGFNDHHKQVVDYHITLKPVGYYRLPYACTYRNTFREGF